LLAPSSIKYLTISIWLNFDAKYNDVKPEYVSTNWNFWKALLSDVIEVKNDSFSLLFNAMSIYY
jgi:hypothetical protein